MTQPKITWLISVVLPFTVAVQQEHPHTCCTRMNSLLHLIDFLSSSAIWQEWESFLVSPYLFLLLTYSFSVNGPFGNGLQMLRVWGGSKNAGHCYLWFFFCIISSTFSTIHFRVQQSGIHKNHQCVEPMMKYRKVKPDIYIWHSFNEA